MASKSRSESSPEKTPEITVHLKSIAGTSNDGTSNDAYNFVKPSMDYSQETPRRKCSALSGNPLIAVVNSTGISDMEIIYCICPDPMPQHEQLLQAGLLPSSFEEPETAFTFSVLDDFLADNLECKTTAQQYYSKLQNITNKMFPYHVPVCNIAILILICSWWSTEPLQTSIESISPMEGSTE